MTPHQNCLREMVLPMTPHQNHLREMILVRCHNVFMKKYGKSFLNYNLCFYEYRKSSMNYPCYPVVQNTETLNYSMAPADRPKHNFKKHKHKLSQNYSQTLPLHCILCVTHCTSIHKGAELIKNYKCKKSDHIEMRFCVTEKLFILWQIKNGQRSP